MLYAFWNPIPWLLFLFGISICVFSVKAFHRKYPDYPYGNRQIEILTDGLTMEVHNPNISSTPSSQMIENAGVGSLPHSSAISGR